jgi:radical SAM modification target selenobiotic family peptide
MMEMKELKKMLAGLSIAGLLTAVAISTGGCETSVRGS